jgi:hypothetical protein
VFEAGNSGQNLKSHCTRGFSKWVSGKSGCDSDNLLVNSPQVEIPKFCRVKMALTSCSF